MADRRQMTAIPPPDARKAAESMPKSQLPIAHLLKKHRLEHHATLVNKSLEPSVRIDVRPPVSRPLRIGSSKFGGLPHLEEGIDWPTNPQTGHPLQLLAQINLADIPDDHASSTALPPEGWLYFWFDSLQDWEQLNTRLQPQESAEYPYGFVTYANAGASLVRTPYPEFVEPKLPAKKKLPHYRAPDFGPYTEHRITFRRVMSMDKDGMSLLFDRADDMANSDADSDEWDRVCAFVSDMHGGSPSKRFSDHRLLGSVQESMGADMRECAQRFYSRRPGVRASSQLTPQNRKSWVMLSMFGSDDSIHRRADDAGWLWSDSGLLCFWIRRADLEGRDFAKAVAVIGNDG